MNETNRAEKIKKIREFRGISQGSMAKYLGMTQQNYSSLEKGKTTFSEERLALIAQLLGLSIDEIDKFEQALIITDCPISFPNYTNNIYTVNFEVFLESIKKPYEALIEQLRQENSFLKSLLEKK